MMDDGSRKNEDGWVKVNDNNKRKMLLIFEQQFQRWGCNEFLLENKCGKDIFTFEKNDKNEITRATRSLLHCIGGWDECGSVPFWSCYNNNNIMECNRRIDSQHFLDEIHRRRMMCDYNPIFTDKPTREID
jgi:hypothetical protein